MNDDRDEMNVSGVGDMIADNQNEPLLVDLLSEAGNATQSHSADASLHFADGDGTDFLDLADILLGAPGADNIDDYVLAINHGKSSTLLVDIGGNGNFANPDLVLEIGGVDWDSGTAGQMASLVDDAVIVVV
ncbi:MAG: type I secretion C-terminal target domain-containing protein [Kiloniellales bacterium]|nr:type I secretion C-terminal target domain-containing protein [Kiloniellales bacterium]